eukprot:1919218-Karenia_brevis.AAC.1
MATGVPHKGGRGMFAVDRCSDFADELGLEERMNRDINAMERIVAFIPAYAAYLYSRLHRGDDGKVA